MKILKFPGKIPSGLKSAVTIGVFDGVHAGHLKLIARTVKEAKKNKIKSIVVTFSGHPDKYFRKDTQLKLIKSLEHNIKLIAGYKPDYCLVLDLPYVSEMSAKEFIDEIIVKKLGAKIVITGRDFVFGKGASGNTALLRKEGKKSGFIHVAIPDYIVAGKKVSSTLIRKALKEGNIKLAEKMLGRPYYIEGTVIEGRHIGTAIGIPTANLKIEYEEIPARGVWAAYITYKGKNYIGAVNIGFAPTMKAENAALIEAFIFDFHQSIYGKKIRVRFIERLRDEKKFKSSAALIAQINKDIAYIKEKYKKVRR